MWGKRIKLLPGLDRLDEDRRTRLTSNSHGKGGEKTYNFKPCTKVEGKYKYNLESFDESNKTTLRIFGDDKLLNVNITTLNSRYVGYYYENIGEILLISLMGVGFCCEEFNGVIGLDIYDPDDSDDILYDYSVELY